MNDYTFSLELRVDDPEQLRVAAEERAVEGGQTPEEWRELRADSLDPIQADIMMLLDPGTLPGCSIHESEVGHTKV